MRDVDVRRVLFVFPAAPMAPNYSGGAARYAQNHEALRGLCEELHVVRVGARGTMGSIREFEMNSGPAKAAMASSASWDDVEYAPAPRMRSRLEIVKRTVVDPVSFEFPDAQIMAPILTESVNKVDPDAIWVEDRDLGAAMYRLAPPVPWVLSHHDLMYRIRGIRHGIRNMRDRWLLNVCRRAERTISRRATCVVTGSATDGQRLARLGCRRISVIPVAYGAFPRLPSDVRPSADVRIVHLGSLETTANRIGLEAYLRRAHAGVMAACRAEGLEPQLWVIGDARRVKEPLAGWIEKGNAVLKGFVPDLSSVLRPFDVSILPYEHDTGFRTKLPLLFSYAQVVVSTRAAVAGMASNGLQDVCVLVNRLDEFPSVIPRLAADPGARERLGRAARAFAEEHFSVNAVRGHYRALLESIPISHRLDSCGRSVWLAPSKAGR